MTQDQFDNVFMPKLRGLFPDNKLEEPQLAVWWDRCKTLALDIALAAIASVYEAAKFPTPKLAEFIDACRSVRSSGTPGSNSVPDHPSLAWVQRQQWIAAEPQNAQQYRDMSDDAVLLLYHYSLFVEAGNQLGYATGAACVEYWHWQAECRRQGKRDDEPMSGSGDEAMKTYLYECGQQLHEQWLRKRRELFAGREAQGIPT